MDIRLHQRQKQKGRGSVSPAPHLPRGRGGGGGRGKRIWKWTQLRGQLSQQAFQPHLLPWGHALQTTRPLPLTQARAQDGTHVRWLRWLQSRERGAQPKLDTSWGAPARPSQAANTARQRHGPHQPVCQCSTCTRSGGPYRAPSQWPWHSPRGWTARGDGWLECGASAAA